jgi:pyridoxamine 5'-phosphate oxidase
LSAEKAAGGLARAASDPIAEFGAAFERAQRNAPYDPTAVALATVAADGAPSVRMVLLKGFDDLGFRFFTNYESRKGAELAGDPRAALCFYWPWIDEQVRVEGAVERLPDEESDRYFATRPRGSQLGAWASRQSQPLPSRFALLRRVAALEAKWLGRAVPRPPHWGGFLLRPRAIEFWTGRQSRLHERRRHTLGASGWSWVRLQP